MRNRILRVLITALALPAILGLLPATSALAAAGTIAVSTLTGPPGTTVSITGTGFTLGGTPSVIWGGTAITNAGSVNGTGALLGCSFVVPSSAPRGNYAVSVTTSNGDTTSNPQSFYVTPALQLSIGSGYVGDQITVSGAGFAASSTVSIYFDGTSVLSTTSSSVGSLSLVLTIPATPWGSHSIRGNDGIGDSTVATFYVSQRVTVTPTDAAVGAALAIVGRGFGASQGVTLYFDEVSAATTTTDSNGSFTLASFPMPAGPSGAHTLRAQDASANTFSVAVNTVQSFAVSPASGPIATKVAATGSGFRATETITLTFDGTAAATTPVVTDVRGNFAATFDVPAAASGTHAVTAADSVSTSSKSYTVTSAATSSPASGFVGTRITVTGSGYAANAAVTVLFDSALAKAGTADAKGSFTITFDAPAKAAGAYKIRATDGSNTKDLDFTVTTSASITPVTSAAAPGNVGGSITVTGVGFKPSGTLTVAYDNKQIATGSVGADAKFSVTFNAPASKAGQHTIVVSDGLNNLALAFFMEAMPPPAPTQVEPLAGSRLKGDGTFTWSPVSDPSGVTYVFQIAGDSGFTSSSILLTKEAMTNAQYTLTKEEKLKPTKKGKPAYWRVKAIDGASNEGAWSNARSFTVGSPFPAWAIWTLVALGAVIIILFAFWLGRRTSPKPPSTRLDEHGQPA
jgi:hypothetical protein